MLNDLAWTINQFISLQIVGYILLFPVVFLWIWGILYVTRDVSHRTDSLMYELFCILIAFVLWPIWLLLYLVIRPYHTIVEASVHQAILSNTQECLECWSVNHHTNKHCVNCWEKLKLECKECKKEMWHHGGNHFCFDCQRLV